MKTLWTERRVTVALAVLTVLGVALRFGWLLTEGHAFFLKPPPDGEASHVAYALAVHGRFADAFFPGQGPTAHLSPVAPMIAAGVYRLFGYGSPLAEGVLTVWAMLLVFASFLLIERVFRRLGSPAWARLLAFAALAILPANYFFEVINFRVWEGALAVAVASAFLLLAVRLDQAAEVSPRQVWMAGWLAGLCIVVTPPMGLAAYLCGFILMLRKVAPRHYARTIGIVAVTAAVALAPWTIRNALVMGQPIVFRDNFGLEFALANYPGAADATDIPASVVQRLDAIHPARPGPGAKAMIAAGGEFAYAKQLGAETKAWVAAHPGEFLRLCARHLSEFLFPPAWFWDSPYGKASGSLGTQFKLAIQWAASLFGLCGIALALIRRRGAYLYPVAMTLVPILPYVIVEPVLRYRYIVFALLVFFAADFVIRLLLPRAAQAKPADAAAPVPA